MRWVLRDDGGRLEGLRIGFTGLARSFLGDDHSALHVVDDGCVAMWRTPSWSPAPNADEPPDGGANGVDRPSPYPPEVQERWRTLGEAIESAHPHDRAHWYLNVLATLPTRRGQGLGAVALTAMSERLDAAGEHAYLESSNPRNMTLYRRHGFEDFGDPVPLPDGPSLYPMWREPRRRG